MLAVGGVVLPSVHRVAHAMETQEERDAHQGAHHGDKVAHLAPEAGTTPLAEAPCPPLPNDVDCAVCSGLSAAADLTLDRGLAPEAEHDAFSAYADVVRMQAAWGAGARAPPIG